MSDGLWPGLLCWAALYCSDYALTLRCARMYQAGVREKIAFEGSYELTPYFQKEIDSLRPISPRFFLALVWTAGTLALVWYLTARLGLGSELYRFLLGALILAQLSVHVRHLRNLHLFRVALSPDGVRGRIEYPRVLTLRLSAIELCSFAAIYLALSLVTGSAFVLGGAVMCLSIAASHWRQARRHQQQVRTSRSRGTPALP